jgi:hypothetical protein
MYGTKLGHLVTLRCFDNANVPSTGQNRTNTRHQKQLQQGSRVANPLCLASVFIAVGSRELNLSYVYGDEPSSSCLDVRWCHLVPYAGEAGPDLP